MKKVDFIAGVVLLVLSGYVIWESAQMPPSTTDAPGTGFFPFWVGVLLALTSVIVLATAWRRPADLSNQAPFPTGKALRLVASVTLGLTIYIAMLEILGFVASTFLFVAYIMGPVERARWTTSLTVAVVTTAGLYVIFQVLLGVTLPRNLFGF